MNLPPINPPQPTMQDICRCLRELCDRVQTITLQNSPPFYVNPVFRQGTVITLRQQASGGVEDTFPQPLHMVFRGEWDSELDYSPGDVVGIYGGANTGTYVCIELAPAGSVEPATSGSTAWTKLSDGFHPNFWE